MYLYAYLMGFNYAILVALNCHMDSSFGTYPITSLLDARTLGHVISALPIEVIPTFQHDTVPSLITTEAKYLFVQLRYVTKKRKGEKKTSNEAPSNKSPDTLTRK